MNGEDKKRITVTIDPDLYEKSCSTELNRSGIVNDLLRGYFEGGVGGDAVLKMRVEQMRSEAEQAKKMYEMKVEQLEKLESRLESRQSAEERELQESVESLATIPWEKLDLTNPGIQKSAEEFSIPEEELLEKVERYKVENDV